VCYGCGRAKGKTKRLAVDHDHRCDAGHPPEFGCPKCIRALLCTYCNEVMGRLDADALRRLIEVHENPPAQTLAQRTGLTNVYGPQALHASTRVPGESASHQFLQHTASAESLLRTVPDMRGTVGLSAR
jgi:hypothetical protein